MAIPPCQGFFLEGANSELDLAPFWAGAYFKNRFGLLEPLREGNDSASPFKGLWLTIGEVLVGALSRAHEDLTLH